MLRKTFRHYDIDNIIVTVSRGLLQLNPDLTIEMLDASPEPEPPLAAEAEPDPAAVPEEKRPFPAATRAAPAGIWLAAACSPSPCCWWYAAFSAATLRTPSP